MYKHSIILETQYVSVEKGYILRYAFFQDTTSSSGGSTIIYEIFNLHLAASINVIELADQKLNSKLHDGSLV